MMENKQFKNVISVYPIVSLHVLCHSSFRCYVNHNTYVLKDLEIVVLVEAGFVDCLLAVVVSVGYVMCYRQGALQK